MGVFCSKIMRYLAMLFMVSIIIPGSSQMPNDQFLNIVGKLLDREHGSDSTENIAENLTKDDKTSITDGLSKLLGLFKDGDKDSVGPKNVNNAKEIDTRSFMDEEQLSEEESESKEGTDMDRDTTVDPEDIVIAAPNEFNKDETEFNAFKLWKEQKEKRVAGSRSFSNGIEKCPEGYRRTTPGDVPGPGLIFLNTGHNIPVGKKRAKERCAEICNHNSRCKSFLYSNKVGECKITAELQPSKPQYQDWVMCSKSDEDKICTQGYTLKIGTTGGDKETLLDHPLDIGLEEMHLTPDECRIKCETHPECKSFEYSENKKNCVLRRVNIRDKTKPKDYQFEDYRWCSKNPCKTTDGPVANEDCVFPFIWRQKKYTTCTNVGDSNNERFWCPTSTGDLEVAQDSKTWGYCNESCPQHQDQCYAIAGPGIGKDCIFPFTDRGKTYHECATSHPVGTPLWCKTDKSEALSENTTSYGICHAGCKKVSECTWQKLGGEGTVAKNDGMTISEFRSKTLDDCKDLCSLNSLCKSFSFKVEGGHCKLKDRILYRNSTTKQVPGTSTYYEPAACHDDTGNQAHAGNFISGSRNVHGGRQRYGSESGTGRFRKGDAHSSGSKNAANRMGEAYPTGDRNDADGMHVSYGSGSDVDNSRRDIADTENGVHEGIEALTRVLQKIAHENENSFDSQVKNDVRGNRDGHGSGSRTGTKEAYKGKEDKPKKHAKIWDKVLQHEELLQKLVDLRNGNI